MTLTPTFKQGNSDVKHEKSVFDLDLWPTTFNPNLTKVKVNHGAKNEGQTVQAGERYKQTDGRYQVHYPPSFAVDKDKWRWVGIEKEVAWECL